MMSTLEEIEEAIAQLSEAELAVLREWFEKLDAEHWDQQFDRDVHSGKLDTLAQRALADFRAGNSKEL